MKTEVFVPYSKNTILRDLKNTLEAWDTDEYEPVALETSEKLKFIAAEALAKDEYLVVDLNTKPGDTEGVISLKKGTNPHLKTEKRAIN